MIKSILLVLKKAISASYELWYYEDPFLTWTLILLNAHFFILVSLYILNNVVVSSSNVKWVMNNWIISKDIKWSIVHVSSLQNCVLRLYRLIGPQPVCFFQALEAVNAQLRELYPDSEELFDIVLVTYNHAHVGVRLINTINHHSECPFIYLWPQLVNSSPKTYITSLEYLLQNYNKMVYNLAERDNSNLSVGLNIYTIL